MLAVRLFESITIRKLACDGKHTQVLQQLRPPHAILCVFLESLSCANTIWSGYFNLKINVASHSGSQSNETNDFVVMRESQR